MIAPLTPASPMGAVYSSSRYARRVSCASSSAGLVSRTGQLGRPKDCTGACVGVCCTRIVPVLALPAAQAGRIRL